MRAAAKVQTRRHRLWILVLATATGIVLLAYLTHPLWLPGFYIYLDVSQSPQSADIIVVLGGGDDQRETYAALLYQQGYALTVLLSGYADNMTYAIDFIIEHGVLESALLINDIATSTYSEAQQVLDILDELEMQSALIVTDAFHTRRAIATYRHVSQRTDINLTIVAPDAGIDPDSWWTSAYRHLVATEYIKMLYYWITFGI